MRIKCALITYIHKVAVLLLQIKLLSLFYDFLGDVITIWIQQNVSKQFVLLIGAPLVHENFTDLLYLFPWHDLNDFLNYMLTVLLSAELVEILSDELIETHYCFVKSMVVLSRLFLINMALQDGLNHKVAILVVD